MAAERFGNAPRHQKVGLGVIALAIATALGYAALSPKMAQRAALSQRSYALAIEARQAQRDEAALRPVRAQAHALRSRLEAARRRLPAEPEIPALFRQLSELAERSGLALTLFAPKTVEEKTGLGEIAISVTLEGTYHQLADFLSAMGRIGRLVSVGEFRLATIERPTGTVRADLTLVAHLLGARGQAPAGAVPVTRAAPPTGIRSDTKRSADGR